MGRDSYNDRHGCQFDLDQQGSIGKGLMRIVAGSSQNVAGAREGPIEGTVAGDVFRFRQPTGRADGEMRMVSEDEMDGRASIGLKSEPLILRKVARPSSQGSSQPPR